MYIVIPIIIYIIYTVLSALHRLWNFEIIYNYDDEATSDIIKNKGYLRNLPKWLFKFVLIDILGRKNLHVFKDIAYNNNLKQDQRESFVSLKRPWIFIIMIVAFFIYFGFCLLPLVLKSMTADNIFLIGLKYVVVLFFIYIIFCCLFNLIEYFSYKSFVVKNAFDIIQKKNETETTNSTTLRSRINFVYNVWMGQNMKEINITQVYASSLEKYNEVLQKAEHIDEKIWKIFEFMSSNQNSLIKMVYFLIFSLLVSQSFKIMKLTLPSLQNIGTDDETVSAKKMLFHVMARVILLAVGSLSIIISYIFFIFVLYVVAQFLINKLLKHMTSNYKSETYEHDYDSSTETWIKKRDHSMYRQWVNMLFISLKKEYPVTVTNIEGVEVERDGNIFLNDQKTLDPLHLQELLPDFNVKYIKDIFLHSFFKNVSLPIILLYVISFFFVITFVIWYESNPVRHKNKKVLTQEEIEDGVTLESEETTDRTKRYAYLYQCCVIAMAFIVGMYIIFITYIQNSPIDFMDRNIITILLKVIMVLILVSIITFFLFY